LVALRQRTAPLVVAFISPPGCVASRMYPDEGIRSQAPESANSTIGTWLSISASRNRLLDSLFAPFKARIVRA
jgi:hypothetical protein